MAISTIESITSLYGRARRTAERSGERLDHSPACSGVLRYLPERYLINKKILTSILRSLRLPLPFGRVKCDAEASERQQARLGTGALRLKARSRRTGTVPVCPEGSALLPERRQMGHIGREPR
jgi:hypothetical protein